jgi:hypothetical protein
MSKKVTMHGLVGGKIILNGAMILFVFAATSISKKCWKVGVVETKAISF